MNSRKIKSKIVVSILCVLMLSLGIALATVGTRGNYTAKAASPIDPSIFTFVATSGTECDVRLANKNVRVAVVPSTAIINNNEYIVTSVATNGFASSSNLEIVRLPDTVKTVGATAFMNCGKLESITLPAVETIGTNAFSMTVLEYLIIPDTTTSVAAQILRTNSTKVYVRGTQASTSGWNVQWNTLNSITTVDYESEFIPPIRYQYEESTKSMSSGSFGFSKMGSSMSRSGGVYVVEPYQPLTQFESNGGVNIYIPDEYLGDPVVGIADYAFMFASYDTITIGYSSDPIRVGSMAFYYSFGTEITFNRDIIFENNDGLPSELVFASSFATTIVLPDTLTELGDSIFQDCYDLMDIHFVEPDSLLTQMQEEALAGSLLSTQIVEIPNTVTLIGANAFSGINNILKLYIPNSVTDTGGTILVGWTTPQEVFIDYVDAASLPLGWNAYWDSGCDLNIINFSAPQIFDITYYLNGGSNNQLNPDTYTKSDDFLLYDATRTGFLFDGWYEDVQFLGNRVYGISLGTTGNKNFYAKWIAITYTISYNGNGHTSGSTTASIHTYDIAKNLTLNGYARTGYSFDSWNTMADGSGTPYINSYSVLNWTTVNNATITLYAQWINNPYTVTLDRQGGTGGNTSVTAIFDNAMPNAVAPTMTGYAFGGYYTGTNGTGTQYYNANMGSLSNWNIANATTLYAEWTANEYTVVYNANGGSGSMLSSQHTYGISKNLSASTYTMTGYYVSSWNTLANGTGTSYAPLASVLNLTAGTGNVPLYAQWSIISYTLVATANSNGLNNDPLVEQGTNFIQNIGSWTMTWGQTQNVNAPSVSNYAFQRWSYDSSTNTTFTAYNMTTVNGATIYLYAIYQYSPSGGGICVTEDTLITLADGSTKRVDTLDGTESLLVWNFYTGTYDSANIVFVESSEQKVFQVVHLFFADGSEVKVLGKHAYWDFDLNCYVIMSVETANDYIGHFFMKHTYNLIGYDMVELVDVQFYFELTSAWSPVTVVHLNFFTGGMLSMPGATEGFMNVFEVDAITMAFDQVQMQTDIATYGLYVHADLEQWVSIQVFSALQLQYLKVAVGKGMMTWADVEALGERFYDYLNGLT